MENTKDTFFVITFRDPDSSEKQTQLSLKVNEITDSNLGPTFIKISQFIFDSGSIIVSPKEEKIRKRFEYTQSLHLSIYSVLSIEEVGNEHKGLHFNQDKSNLLVMNPNKQ